MNASPCQCKQFTNLFFTVEEVNTQRLRLILLDMVRRSQDTDSEVCSLSDNINFLVVYMVTWSHPYTELNVSLLIQPFTIRQLSNKLLREIPYKQLDILCAVCRCKEYLARVHISPTCTVLKQTPAVCIKLHIQSLWTPTLSLYEIHVQSAWNTPHVQLVVSNKCSRCQTLKYIAGSRCVTWLVSTHLHVSRRYSVAGLCCVVHPSAGQSGSPPIETVTQQPRPPGQNAVGAIRCFPSGQTYTRLLCLKWTCTRCRNIRGR